MASITLSTVRTAIRERGDFKQSRVYTSDIVDREAQAAWTALHRVVEEVHEGWFDKEATASTVANQAYVPLSGSLADVRRVKGVDLLDGTEYRPLSKLPIGARHRYGRTADEPDAYRLTERGVDLFPTPNAVYTLRVVYSRKVIPLSAIAVEVDEEWQDFVVWKAIIALAASQERATGEYEREMARAEMAIRGGASGRDQTEPEYLILREYRSDWDWGY
jgi:hypothetical protein